MVDQDRNRGADGVATMFQADRHLFVRDTQSLLQLLEHLESRLVKQVQIDFLARHIRGQQNVVNEFRHCGDRKIHEAGTVHVKFTVPPFAMPWLNRRRFRSELAVGNKQHISTTAVRAELKSAQ